MSRAPFLRTLDRPALTTTAGEIRWDDPRSYAFLVMLTLSGPGGLAEQDALLRLAPDLTPSRAREALAHCIEEIERALGPGSVIQTGDRVRLGIALATDVVRGNGAGIPAGDRFLAQFVLPDSPEFADWLARERSRIAPLPRRGPALSATGLRMLAVAGAALLLLLGAMAFARRMPAKRLSPGALVVVADVVNQTGDAVFDHGLTLATGIVLQQEGNIQPLSPERILGALRRAGRAPSDSLLTVALASEVALREGVAWVVVPRIQTAGGGYRVGVTILDAATGDTVAAEDAPAEGKGGVLPALEQVVRAARRDRSPDPNGAGNGRPLPFVTTTSLEALRSFAEGGRAWSRTDFRLAREFWTRAIDLDSGFAMAMGAMGSWSYYHFNRDEGYRYYDAALARQERLSEYERLQLRGSWASYRGLTDSALLLGRQLTERFPGAGTWYDYGTALMRAGKCDEATDALRRSLEFDSASASPHVNLATCLRRGSDWPAAVTEYERASRLEPEVLLHGNVAFEFGSTLVLAGLRDSAERHFARLQHAQGLFERALGARGRGWIAWFEGHPAEAARYFDAAAFVSRQQGLTNSLVRGLALSGRAHAAAGDSAAAKRSFDEMMTLIASSDQVPPLLAIVGTSLAASGRVADAEALLRTIRAPRSRTDRDDAPAGFALAGAIALARGNGRAALEALDQANGFVQPVTVTLLRARALDRLGRSDSAQALRRSITRSQVFGFESGFEWIEEPGR